MPHEEGSDVVETEPPWRSVVHRGHVPPLSASGTFGREATAVQQFLEIQIASPDTVDVSVSVAVEQEQLALGTGNDNDKCSMQIPAVAPRNQLIRRPVADLKRWRVATDVHHRARRAREFLEFLGRTSEKPVQPRGAVTPGIVAFAGGGADAVMSEGPYASATARTETSPPTSPSPGSVS